MAFVPTTSGMTQLRHTLSLVFLLLCIFITPSLIYLPALDYMNVPREAFWVGLSLIAFFISIVFQKKVSLNTLDYGFILFLTFSFLSSLWSLNPHLSFQRWSILFAAYITYSITKSLPRSYLKYILWSLTFQGFYLSLLAFFQKYYLDLLPHWITGTFLETSNPGASMGHRNVAAEYLLITLGISCGLFFNILQRYLKERVFSSLIGAQLLFLVLNIIFHLWMIKVTFCRGVIIGIALATALLPLLVYFNKDRKKTSKKVHSRWINVIIFICVLSFGAVSYFIFKHYIPKVDPILFQNKSESIQSRLAHYSNTMIMAKDTFPKGVGLGNFSIFYGQYIHSWIPDKHYNNQLILKNVHNDYLECIAELGPLGLLIFLALIFYVLFKLKTQSTLALWLKWILLAQAINALFNFPLQVIQTQMALSICLGILLIHASPLTSKSFKIPYPSIALSLLAFLAYLYFQYQVSVFQGHMAAREGLNLLYSNNPKSALNQLKYAEKELPKNINIKMLLAYAYRESGDFIKSSSQAEKVLGLFPNYLAAHHLIGLNALKINDLNRAIHAFENSYHIQPLQISTQKLLAQAYYNLSNEYYQKKNQNESATFLRKTLSMDPDHHDARYRLIAHEAFHKNFDLCQKLLEPLLESEDPRSLYFRAYLELHHHKNKNKALELTDKAIQSNPNNALLKHLREEIINYKG